MSTQAPAQDEYSTEQSGTRGPDGGDQHPSWTRAGDDPRVPGEGRLAETLLGFATSFTSAGLMATLALVLQRPFIFPSLGATVFLLFYRSKASAASPRNTILGHLIGAGCGIISLAAFGLLDAPSVFVSGMTWSRVGATALSLGLTSGAMAGFRLPHPPAGATTLIVSLGLLTTAEEIVVLCGAIGIAVALAALTHRIFGTPYPRWRPFDELPQTQDPTSPTPPAL